MWNFHGFCFLVLEFRKVVAQFCGISWGEAFLWYSHKPKNFRDFLKNICFNHSCLSFFWNSPIMLTYGRLELNKNSTILGDGSRWDINLKWSLILKKTMKKVPTPPLTSYYYVLQKSTKKNQLYDIFLGMGFNCLKIRATSRRQLTFLAISNMWLNMSCLAICVCGNQE